MSPIFRTVVRALLLLAPLTGSNAFTIEKRALALPYTLPGSWTSKGCYVDVGRTLKNGGYNDNLNMTAENCINYCSSKGNIYAGTEYGQECYCGMSIDSKATSAATADCSVPCTGNATQPCGGGNRLNLFWSGTTGPQTNSGPGLWKFAGCWAEGTTGRALPNGVGTTGGSGLMTVSLCTSACQAAGYNLAGAEYGGECYCGNSIANGGTLAPEGVSGCNMLCNGNFSEFCGAGSRLDIYNYNNAVVLPPYTTVTSSTSSTSSSVSSSSSSSVAPSISSTSSSLTISTSSLSSVSSTTSSRAPSSTSSTSRSSTSMTSSVSLSLTSSSSRTSTSTISPTSSRTSTSSTASLASSTSRSSTSSSTTSSSSRSSTSATSSSTSSSRSSTSATSSSTSSSRTSTSTFSSSTSSSRSSTSTTSASSSSRTSTSSTSITSSSPSQTSTSAISSTSSSSSRSSTSSSTSSTLSPSGSSSSTSSTSSSTSSSSNPTGSSTSSLSSSTASSTSVSSSSTVSISSSSSTGLLSSSTFASSSSSSTSLTLSSTYSSSIFSSTSLSSSSIASSSGSTSSTASSSSIASSSSSISSTISSSSSVSITSSSASPTPTVLSHRATISGFSYQGCYTEGTGVRALTGAVFYDYVGMTLEICASNCAAFTYFGVEYGGECFCGNSLGAGSVLAAPTDCSFTCPGNALEYCGAGSRLEMYKVGPAPTGSSSSSFSSAASTVSVTSSTSSSAPTPTGFPAGWTDQGCWVDGTNGRIMNNQQNDNPAMTLQSCVNTCAGLGYSIAGMEYGAQCFCDNFIYNGGAKAANQAECNMPCAGNAAQKCGAGGRLTIYSAGTPQVFQPPGPQTTDLPVGWTYSGCLEDNIASVENPNEQLPTFPYKVWDNLENTPTACITHCQTFGFNAAGLEYGSQCFCGDVENIKVASAPGVSTDPADTQYYTRSRIPQVVPDARCEAKCTGDKMHLCGAGNLLTYYTFQGATPLYKWDFPTGNAAGKYDFLIGGVVVPLMTAQMITGKITFIEKYGSGEPNGTGAYEMDVSQANANNFGGTWRAMTGLQTDVFCSAGLILPDKAGRQLTIGGWAGESNYGVRLYTPDGSEGIPGTNQWAEDKAGLRLQVPRWYPSALIMANGSILIIGGEVGSNAAEQPTLEILPATGVPDAATISGYSNTTKYLDFLDRTAPFNLYPFITVVPSGIFIAYYNEARILDEVTFETKKILPNMPGAVNDPKGGRSYQLEGTMVTLPQKAPYTANLEVLVCGGSTEAGGSSIDNCITTAPEDDNPVWTIERMPSRRVMPCMAGLPDGTYAILNGAQHGVAGFGLGGSPNTNAVIYDPSKPLKQRMSVMANTTIARLYHSEAIVMLDGRVLVTGSDPTGDYSQPPGNYPEEYRVEVFSPPYLTSGLPRPSFTITNKDWAYNQPYSFTISTPIAAANLKVTLLGAVVSTHGNSMGQRTLVPAVSCTGTSCTVTSPNNAHTAPPGWFMMFVLDGPTPSVGVWVRIGGDPAGLGNWPQLPAFVLPGV